MKALLYSILFILAGFTINAQEGAIIQFDEEKHNFGEVDEGPQITHEFVFTNTGTEPLILSKVKASCGCTTPSWPKDPILPGEEGVIVVTYNTAKRVGGFNKSVTITSNASEPTKVIYISGKVNAVPEVETMPINEPLLMAPSQQ